MKELVVISGKGGTGKTSVVGAFASLAQHLVLADCDVDAANLHLILNPEIRETISFEGHPRARIHQETCLGCGQCASLCRFHAVRAVASYSPKSRTRYEINPQLCEGCGVCEWFCEGNAIEMLPQTNGMIYRSETRFGPLVHAELGIGMENSGKLVTQVRHWARDVAAIRSIPLILIDGSPGIGCPVIASVSCSDAVLIVTEPTLSGWNDLQRVIQLTADMNLKTMVCINKWDINPELSQRMENFVEESPAEWVGNIRYDDVVLQAQIKQQTLMEYQNDGITVDLKDVWRRVSSSLERYSVNEKSARAHPCT